MKLTDTQLDEIERTAKHATPGPWREDSGRALSSKHNAIFGTRASRTHDLEHVANMCPDTTIALLAEVKAQRTSIAEVRAELMEEFERSNLNDGDDAVRYQRWLSRLDAVLGETA